MRLLWNLLKFAFQWAVPIRCLWCGVWWPLIGKGNGGPRQPWHCKNCGRGV